jgi:predicted Zn-dependent protease
MTRLPARLLLAAALASAVPAAPPAQAQAPSSAIRLPALGDIASEALSVGDERHLGDQIMAELRRDPDVIDDPLLLDYVQSLWQPLLAASRDRGNIGVDLDKAYAWEPFLIRDRQVNAFALPGGYIGVYLGMIALTGSRDELASVLAHEMSHVTQRHIARSIASASRQSLVGMAAMILGVLATSHARNGDATQAVVVGSQAAMAQGQLNYSRDMEREADRIGWGVYSTAGFAPIGFAAMFDRLDNASRLNDSGNFPYLRSHPLTVERIGEARARYEASPGPHSTVRVPLDHLLMQARARVLMDRSDAVLRRLQGQDTAPFAAATTGNERIAALYASAVASLELRDAMRAQAALDAAQSLARDKLAGDARAARALLLLQAEVLQAVGQPARALALLDGPASAAEPSRPLLLARAQAALDVARSGGDTRGLRNQTEALQIWVAEQGRDASAWALLAQCAEALGLHLRSLRAEAESHAALGDLSGAIDRLRSAQRQAREARTAPDFIEASIIDSRLRDLNAQRRAQLAEARGERGRQELAP